jgi:hypothetical protein
MSYLHCLCLLRMVVSNIYCVVFLFCFLSTQNTGVTISKRKKSTQNTGVTISKANAEHSKYQCYSLYEERRVINILMLIVTNVNTEC